MEEDPSAQWGSDLLPNSDAEQSESETEDVPGLMPDTKVVTRRKEASVKDALKPALPPPATPVNHASGSTITNPEEQLASGSKSNKPVSDATLEGYTQKKPWFKPTGKYNEKGFPFGFCSWCRNVCPDKSAFASSMGAVVKDAHDLKMHEQSKQ